MSARTVYRRRVPWGDVDAAGIWRFVAALGYVEEAETQLMRELGIMEDVGIRLPRVHVEADFLRAARFDDEIEVHLVVDRVGRRSLHYAFTILVDAQVAVAGKLSTVYLNDEAEPTAIPPRARDLLARGGRRAAPHPRG